MSEASTTNYDVIVIGAGPIGLACGIEATKLGLSYLILDKGTLVNSIYHYPSGMTFFSTSEKLEIGAVPFISHQPKPNRDEALEYYRRVAQSWKLNVKLYEELKKVKDTSQDGYHLISTKSSYSCQFIVLATGFYDIPHLLDIPGEDLSKVMHYYKEAHPFYAQKLAIIGSSNSAVDAALECFRKGAEVTMLIRSDKIGDNVKYWVKPDIENRISEGSIKAYFHTEIKEITEETIKFTSEGKAIEIDNDFVLALTGYEPNFKWLEELGIKHSSDEKCIPMHNPATMETNRPGIFLAGVICGGMETNKWFIENSRIHAENIMKEIGKRNAKA
ncbi:MAG: YpdA family putative bacillithiol disulfide reductase [Saprospiraceae bacterium]|nr:YpdA family putative bacillithiol disulfide reductase [Saprospiraceae bacterium]